LELTSTLESPPFADVWFVSTPASSHFGTTEQRDHLALGLAASPPHRRAA
jgi:hypothetical protein